MGNATTTEGAMHAFLYSGSKMTDLGTLGGTYSIANAINDRGQVVGNATTTEGAVHAFLYSGSKMTDLGTLGGTNSYAGGINNSGQVVGAAFTAGVHNLRPFLYDGSTLIDLNTLIDPHSDCILGSAYDINDSGQILGVGINGSGQTHAFILTPVPEPSTLTLLGISIVGLLAYAWRKRQ